MSDDMDSYLPDLMEAAYMNSIDPQQFGELRAEVESLRRDHDKRDRTIDKMAGQIDELLALANKSKGGFWAGMAIASALGGVVTFAADHFLKP